LKFHLYFWRIFFKDFC